MSADRLTALRAKLKASLRADGTPKGGYAERVAALRAEIARLEGGNA